MKGSLVNFDYPLGFPVFGQDLKDTLRITCDSQWKPICFEGHVYLGGAFIFFGGEVIQFDEHIFEMGWSHQLDTGYYLYLHL